MFPVVFLGGPSSVGKSTVAVALAARGWGRLVLDDLFDRALLCAGVPASQAQNPDAFIPHAAYAYTWAAISKLRQPVVLECSYARLFVPDGDDMDHPGLWVPCLSGDLVRGIERPVQLYRLALTASQLAARRTLTGSSLERSVEIEQAEFALVAESRQARLLGAAVGLGVQMIDADEPASTIAASIHKRSKVRDNVRRGRNLVPCAVSRPMSRALCR